MTVESASVACPVPGTGGSVQGATGPAYPQCTPMKISTVSSMYILIEETVRELFEEQHNFT